MKEELKNPTPTEDKSITMENEEQNPKTVIQQATQLVDSVTNMLYVEIIGGKLPVPEQEISLSRFLIRQKSSMIKVEMPTIDLDEHKKLVKKFMRQNKKIKKKRQTRSLQQLQKSIKIEKEFKMQKINERSQLLEERRKQIEKRMEVKKSMMSQIRKSSIETDERVKKLRKKKFLYQEKEDEFYSKVILPKIQEEKKIIQKKKQLRRAMDLSEISLHEKQYDQLKIHEQLNRSLTLKMIQEENDKYSPPAYIPHSYRMYEKEKKLMEQEQYLKKKQSQINSIKKKEFLRHIDEIRQRQRELSKSRSPLKAKQGKERIVQQKSREQTKKMGNQYLKKLLQSRKKFMTTRKFIKQPVSVIQIPKKKIKSQYQLQIIREERTQQIHKIKARKIDGIVHNKSLDNLSKYERLKHESQKLDEQAEFILRDGEDIKTINESASIMMTSIYAKLAMLGFDQNKKMR